jgi:hypothetical protein
MDVKLIDTLSMDNVPIYRKKLYTSAEPLYAKSI